MQKALIIFTATVIIFLTFLKLGQHPLSAWDEARRGINAIEMLRTSDPVNLYFAGQPETSNFKPPLAVWAKAVPLKALGFNELALRLPSALAILAAFFFVFNIIRLYRSASFAALTCLLLTSAKGLIGWHVGRTGDTDALLVLFHLASIFCFLLYIDFGKKWAAVPFELCLGLAFLTKGAAAYTLLPGMALYAFFTKKIRMLGTSKAAWGGAALALAFPIVWYLVHRQFGLVVTLDEHTANAFQHQFYVDLWSRFTEPAEGTKAAFDPAFFVYSLDKTFNLWHYVFFGLLAFGLVLFLKNRGATWQKLLDPSRRLLLLSLCLYLPLALFLAIAANSHSWYMAPLLPFVGIATMWGIRHFWKQKAAVKWAYASLLAFTLARQVALFWQVPSKPDLITRFAPLFSQTKTIVVASQMEQDLLCYLYFFGKKMRFDHRSQPLGADELMVVRQTEMPNTIPEGVTKIGEIGAYGIYKTQ